MKRLLALLRDWLAYSVPEEVTRDLPQTLAEFRAKRDQQYPQENVDLARRRVEELNVTRSPIHRRRSA